MSITIRIGESPDAVIGADGNNGAPVGGVTFTLDDPALATFQLTGNGKDAIVHPQAPGTTVIHASGVNENGDPISGQTSFTVLPAFAWSLVITRRN